MRLTEQIKNQILQAAYTKAGIPKERERIRKLYAAWAEKARIHSLGGEDAALGITAVIGDIQCMLHTLPTGIVRSADNLLRYGYYIAVAIGDQYRQVYFNGAFGGWHPECGSVSKIVSADMAMLDANHPLAKEYEVIHNQALDIEKLIRNVRSEVQAILSSVTTTIQLVKVWPEAVELLPPQAVKEKKQLTSVQTESLNKILGLPSKE